MFLFQNDRTSLHLAAEKGNLEAVDKLVQMRCDMNKKDNVNLHSTIKVRVRKTV